MKTIKTLCREKWIVVCLLLFSPPGARSIAAPALEATHAAARAVIAVQQKVTRPLLDQLPDILGTAVAVNAQDKAVLKVYVDQEGPNAAQIVRALPATIDGVPLEIELTEKFRALAGKGNGNGNGKPNGVSHTDLQTGWIQMGTSGGWAYDTANGFCCGGTLGALLTAGGKKYILSNYHIFEGDIVDGGNSKKAQPGDEVIQPALIDAACNPGNTQVVGALVPLRALSEEPWANVDASIAETKDTRVIGSILGIGPISSATATPSVRLGVKKSGRTTGVTRSSVSGLNATIRIVYDNECAGGAGLERIFQGQIVIGNKGRRFLDGGDSGALLLEDKVHFPRALGLLFAGSNSTAIANPIAEVLAFVSAGLGEDASILGE
jgi:hypothetical protein